MQKIFYFYIIIYIYSGHGYGSITAKAIIGWLSLLLRIYGKYIKKGKKIPAKTLARAAKAGGKLGQRARLAQTFKKMRRK